MFDSQDEQIITKVNKEKAIVLTFDDGPSKLLPSILDILKEEAVPAVFFWQSRLLYPTRPWQRALDEGHQIGTHSTKHVNLAKLPKEKQYVDIKSSVEKIERIIGQKVTYFRPPFGQYNEATLEVLAELKLRPIFWRVAAMDWELKCDPQEIVTNVMDHLEDGAILLLHELKQTVEVLPSLIQAIKAREYSFSLLE
ncbi:peptidoglycan/xylan/chitin deacetylase (PgdA/CDA1 family) [Salirhabdus euzebyi]|uniref:Peptidoglycan/xylan/chitin deacetylase (PgdA/CDA1 family) n=1 Tax=Salirhabdus euzebyi TaxID=394506 RepID=A0A841Q2D8_9BACI|nr:polysaccharide deacetylase family protein [Salirhabdus euzebyi]MBB6452435.1 peptidoglycan/xylan/chitin deacetylase (PgdA/CDA1 family) [Salirhabdus euzebyi]